MYNIIIILLLLILLLNFKNNYKPKQYKNKNKNKNKNITGGVGALTQYPYIGNTNMDVSDRYITGGGIGTFGSIEAQNFVILFIVLTIILCNIGLYIKISNGSKEVDISFIVGICCVISSLGSLMVVLIEPTKSYIIIKILIMIAIMISTYSTWIDVSALMSYQSGCMLETFGMSLQNVTEEQEQSGQEETVAEEAPLPDSKPYDLDNNFKYTPDELNNLSTNAHDHKMICMNMHLASHMRLKQDDSILGRLWPGNYSKTSWGGTLYNYIVPLLIVAVLTVNENNTVIS